MYGQLLTDEVMAPCSRTLWSCRCDTVHILTAALQAEQWFLCMGEILSHGIMFIHAEACGAKGSVIYLFVLIVN